MTKYERLKQNYQILRQAGFNAKEATRYKFFSKESIDELCKTRQKANERVYEILCEKQRQKKN